jgi:frataxin-like iron-binding protein CyaY
MKRIMGALLVILFVSLGIDAFATESKVGKDNIKDYLLKNTRFESINTNLKEDGKLKINTIKQDLLCLMLAYPEYVVSAKQEQDGRVWLITKQGGKILYDDKKTKTYQEKLENADIQDTMEQIYPINNERNIMDINYDPGRSRVYNLLNIVYGNNKKQIEKNMVKVNINNHNYLFNSRNNASKSLLSTFKQLQTVSKSNYSITKYIYPCSGTYNYRVISGTNRLSAHSYGIAIDLASNKSDYWKWTSREKGNERIKKYPTEIIKAFEDNNFIWGGKWGHFDILHFEYRPEVILKGKYFGNNSNKNETWHLGVDVNDKRTKELIKIIDNEISRE